MLAAAVAAVAVVAVVAVVAAAAAFVHWAAKTQTVIASNPLLHRPNDIRMMSEAPVRPALLRTS